MNTSKLIVIEGHPGAGKTTTAKFVQQWLEERGITTRLFLEGDLHHPADYECVAHCTHEEYAGLLAAWPEQRAILEANTTLHGDDCFVGYCLCMQQSKLPGALFSTLAARDIYMIKDFATHARLIREGWQRFTGHAMTEDTVTIFECCLLQNPFTTGILYHNLPEAQSLAFVGSLLDSVQPLKPLIVYLDQPDVEAALWRIAEQRPIEWQHAVGGYVDQGQWASAHGTQGFEGYIAAAPVRRELELKLLREHPTVHTVIDVTDRDWDHIHNEVVAELEKMQNP